jgi:dipeptidyl aminopeptidase/acylaminoacyl peptidase
MKKYSLLFSLLFSFSLLAQKKPLDHSVYDGWQSIGERMISNNGKWVVYTINPQEGDNELVIQSSDAVYKKVVARGYNAKITEDGQFVIFKIRPFYKDTRDARIKKKKLDDFPKDSLGIIELGKDSVWKKPRVKSFTTPEKSFGWLVYQMEKPLPDTAKAKRPDPNYNKTIDSLKKIIDSLKYLNQQLSEIKKNNKDESLDFAEDDPSTSAADAGTDVVVRKLGTNYERVFKNVLSYYFNKQGTKLLLNVAKNQKDSLSRNLVVLYDVRRDRSDTISRGGNDFKNLVMPDEGVQAAYVAERDSSTKALQKFYKLWYYKEGMDSAISIIDRSSPGMPNGSTVSENAVLSFSKTGKRLFFGTAPIQLPKDTTVPDIDKVSIDIWNYKDDYLQTVQLNRLQADLRKNYLAVYDITAHSMQQLESDEMSNVYQTNEGDGETFVGVTDYGKRIEGQWTGRTKKDVYAINPNTGAKKLVLKDGEIVISPQWLSPSGKYILWYDYNARNYFAYDGDSVRNITAKIKVPLWNEENDVPETPGPYGVMSWHEGDSAVYVYDRYDVWRVDPSTVKVPEIFKHHGKGHTKSKISVRYVRTNPEERFVTSTQDLIFRLFDGENKSSSLYRTSMGIAAESTVPMFAVNFGAVSKAKYTNAYIFTREDYSNSPDLYLTHFNGQSEHDLRLSAINPQQSQYNWGTAELFKWKAYNGKETMGIVYKPEDFDPKKKYPMICYFYETLSDGLYGYIPPSPTPSRLNIPFFVSRGYIVFAPDIHYGTGHPAKDCYNHVVSGARALVKLGFVDSTRIGIQGQSWGGIQVAQLVTMTNFFKAAWAGAPVANMTSAYGGIRWESGVTRQFQYEKSQSRIGATLWEKPELYIENSPLFHLPKVKTPLVIMANDADGAVPWWQGIELFTGMKRLGKQVWMLTYNGEAHNLVERRNRKDIQIREQQYFDWLLKGEKPPKWITEGVPAVKKGKDWGLEIAE